MEMNNLPSLDRSAKLIFWAGVRITAFSDFLLATIREGIDEKENDPLYVDEPERAALGQCW